MAQQLAALPSSRPNPPTPAFRIAPRQTQARGVDVRAIRSPRAVRRKVIPAVFRESHRLGSNLLQERVPGTSLQSGTEYDERVERRSVLPLSKSWMNDFYNAGPSSESLSSSTLAPQPSPAPVISVATTVTPAPPPMLAPIIVTIPTQGTPSSIPIESTSHVVVTSQYPDGPGNILQSDTPQYVASVMYRLLIEHGCPDITLWIDPRGFSSSAVAEGGFGDIWTGRFHGSRRKLAIKVLRFACLIGDNANKELKRITREIYHWSKLDHENVNKLKGVIMFQERLGMVSEWMECGNLRQYLNRNTGANRLKLCVQMAKGVTYLHGVNMIHGDLKARNVLVSSTGILKITDFDFSIFPECSLAFSATTRMGGGTLRWMAPELVLKEKPPQRNLKTDIYALGMTFLETITNDEPYFQCEHDAQILFALARKEHPKRSEERFPDTELGNSIWYLLLQCWDFDPVSRPTSNEILGSLLAL